MPETNDVIYWLVVAVVVIAGLWTTRDAPKRKPPDLKLAKDADKKVTQAKDSQQ